MGIRVVQILACCTLHSDTRFSILLLMIYMPLGPFLLLPWCLDILFCWNVPYTLHAHQLNIVRKWKSIVNTQYQKSKGKYPILPSTLDTCFASSLRPFLLLPGCLDVLFRCILCTHWTFLCPLNGKQRYLDCLSRTCIDMSHSVKVLFFPVKGF